jgi:hypothetical protein
MVWSEFMRILKDISQLLLFVLLNQLFAVDLVKSQVFQEVSKSKNIIFEHKDARAGKYHFTETLGSGLAWLDINNDEFIDLLLINGDSSFSTKFYLNENGKFNDVTKEKMITSDSRGMGVCSADINQDGWVDFLITNYGNDILYINHNGEKFSTHQLDSKIQTNQWSTSCAFADLDNDGDLDLYVTRYVEYNLDGNNSCQTNGAKGYCNPEQYLGQTDGLYLNDGTGVFLEVGETHGVSIVKKDRGLGVVISDFDQDNDLDIYVANDGSANRLYINDGQGYFKDKGLISGVAINQNGLAEASMGVALGDVDNNGYQDLIVSHFSMETNTAYLNKGKLLFSDSTNLLKLSQASYMFMGWGLELKDFNNDGFEDLVVANGHIHEFIKNIDSRQSYEQENQLFINQKQNQFQLTLFANPLSSSKNKSSRGLATADWNNDGRIDLAINNINDSLDVYENISANSNNWLGISLVGSKLNRSAIGAVVTVQSNNLKQRKEVISGGSFMSQSDIRLIFGLGSYNDPVTVLIVWPDGKMSEYKIEKLNQYHKIQYR